LGAAGSEGFEAGGQGGGLGAEAGDVAAGFQLVGEEDASALVEQFDG
jgi:hypothetical protein